MIVLGIDCSTKTTCIGTAQDGIVLSELNEELGRSQSSKLPSLAENVLTEASASLKDIGLIAVGTGPGYYTGIRSGVAYAAALAEALSLKVVPLSSLELFVYDLRDTERLLAPVVRARRNSFYCALFSSDGESLTPVAEPCFIKSAQFAELLGNYPEALIVGSDAEEYEELKMLSNRRLSRLSGSGGQAALMGDRYRQSAAEPEKIRGVYLREPDIGPVSE